MMSSAKNNDINPLIRNIFKLNTASLKFNYGLVAQPGKVWWAWPF